MGGLASSSALWYLTRGTGVVSLVLLTVTVALGVANAKRAHATRVPRFVIDAIHRNASLLALAFLAVHIGTSVIDTYVPIRLLDAVIPFGSAYRPMWLGLGAVSLDLLLAIAITSLLRGRLGHRAWRTTHWLAYASWPVAVVHSLGTGSDASSPWMLAVLAVCITVVLVAVRVRLRGAGTPSAPLRTSAASAGATR